MSAKVPKIYCYNIVDIVDISQCKQLLNNNEQSLNVSNKQSLNASNKQFLDNYIDNMFLVLQELASIKKGQKIFVDVDDANTLKKKNVIISQIRNFFCEFTPFKLNYYADIDLPIILKIVGDNMCQGTLSEILYDAKGYSLRNDIKLYHDKLVLAIIGLDNLHKTYKSYGSEWTHYYKNCAINHIYHLQNKFTILIKLLKHLYHAENIFKTEYSDDEFNIAKVNIDQLYSKTIKAKDFTNIIEISRRIETAINNLNFLTSEIKEHSKGLMLYQELYVHNLQTWHNFIFISYTEYVLSHLLIIPLVKIISHFLYSP